MKQFSRNNHRGKESKKSRSNQLNFPEKHTIFLEAFPSQTSLSSISRTNIYFGLFQNGTLKLWTQPSRNRFPISKFLFNFLKENFKTCQTNKKNPQFSFSAGKICGLIFIPWKQKKSLIIFNTEMTRRKELGGSANLTKKKGKINKRENLLKCLNEKQGNF